MATKTATAKKVKEEKITLSFLRKIAEKFFTKSETDTPTDQYYTRSYVGEPFEWNDEELEDAIIGALPDPEPPAFMWDFVSNGETKALVYCPKCGHVTKFENHSAVYRRSCCECCTKEFNDLCIVSFKDDTSAFCKSRAVDAVALVLAADAEREYAVFAAFDYRPLYHSIKCDGMPTDVEFKALADNYTFEFLNIRFFVYCKDIGVRRMTDKGFSSNIYFPNVKFLPSDGYDTFVHILKDLGIGVSKDGINIRSIEELEKVETKSSIASSKRREEKEQLILEEDELYINHVVNDVESLILDHCKGVRSAYVYDSSGAHETAIMACPSCGHISIGETINETVACPLCGEQVPVGSRFAYACGCTDVTSFVDWSVANDGSLIASEYNCKSTLNIEKKSLSQEVTLSSRRVFKPTGHITYYNRYDYKTSRNIMQRHPSSTGRYFSRGNVTGPNYLCDNVVNFFRSRDNLKETISQSTLANSGFIEALGLNDDSNISPLVTPVADNLYLAAYKTYPIIELLVKCKMFSLADDIMLYVSRGEKLPESEYKKATTIQEAFGLNKATFKMARVNDLSLAQISTLKQHYALDPTMSYTDFDWSTTTYNSYVGTPNAIVQLMSETGCTLKRVREYITSCYYNQCIAYTESARLWKDYIGMMKKLKFSPKQIKKELFPKSLKKSHDILNFASINICDEANHERFLETIEGAKKYRYTFGDYLLTTPESAEDIIKEGIDLNHSVAQHIELVVDKLEYICFIRKKSDPETSFYTVELVNNDIVQVRGNSNCPVLEDDVKFFIKKWAKFKKLNIKSL